MSFPGSSPFELPLTSGAFRAALRDGKGRARRHAALHGLHGVLADAVHATLHNLALDPQTEGGRGEWMVDMLVAAGALEAALPELRPGLEASAILAEGLGRWDRSQRCGVLKALVRRGESWARDELMETIRGDDEWAFGYALGTSQLLELDGAAGVVTLAAMLGERVEDLDPDDLAFCLASELDDELLDGARAAARAALAEAAPSCAGARQLLASFDESRAGAADHPERSSGKRPNPEQDAAGAIAWVESLEGEAVPELGRGSRRLRRWASRAAPEALRRIAEAWVEATTDHRRFAYAQAFCARGNVPFVDDRMIAMAESGSAEVAYSARRALRQQRDPRVRAMALRHIDAAGLVDGWHALLDVHFELGDVALLERALRDLLDREKGRPSAERLGREDWHTVTRQFLTLAKDEGRSGLGPVLVASYELSPCGECRTLLACYLHDSGLMPPWIRAEVELDAGADGQDWPWDRPGP